MLTSGLSRRWSEWPILTLLPAAGHSIFICGNASVYSKEIELEKGDYTIKLQLVHPSHELLDKIKALPLIVDTKLAAKEKDLKLEIRRGNETHAP
jgi:Tripeptidyl peptidase II